MVGGDILSSDIHLQRNAQTLITTAAAAKIYRSNGLIARQTIHLKIDAGAHLDWLPQEAIIFNGAIYRQDLKVELAPGASWLGWEITRFGRSARGEKFLQGEWRSQTEVWQQGKPLWIDRQWLPSGEEVFNSPHGLAGKPIVGTLACLGDLVSPEIVEQARKLSRTREGIGEVGLTQLLSGLLCRYRGSSTREVRNWFTQVWQLLHRSHSGHLPNKPRIWQ